MTLLDIKRRSTPLVKVLLVAVAFGAQLACRGSWSSDSNKAWQGAQLIGTNDAGDAFKPQIAMDAIGNGLAVWTQSAGTRSSIWANRYTPAKGWSKAERIDIDDANGNVRDPRIAMDTYGNGLAVWSQSDNTFSHNAIWASRHTPTGGWEKAERIKTHDGWTSVSDLQVVLGSTGNGFSVWIHKSYAVHVVTYQLVFNRYSRANGWGEPQVFYYNSSPSYCSPISSPKIALDIVDNGLLVVWEQYTLNYLSSCEPINLWASRYTPATGWTGVNLVETNDAGSASDPQIAMDAKGNGLSVWAQSDGSRRDIWANRYSPHGGWEIAELIEIDDTGSTQHPQIAMDTEGNGLSVWTQSDGIHSSVWANRYTPHGRWETAELIKADDAESTRNPKIAMDANGNGLAVWQQLGNTHPSSIWAGRFTPSAGWESAELIVSDNAGAASAQQIALNARGNGLVVWQQFDGTRNNIWANSFSNKRKDAGSTIVNSNRSRH